ncbi:aldo/keto reductase [Nocardiopsis rhodophaea]|uniref:Aldo/keto reductase n=1 Tax=Nocardiopsis rhodophaea TaxID=280238 RepID=A0ABN2S8K6_9ACTN
MRYRLLGRTGLRVSEVFLGSLGFGEEGGGVPLTEAKRILDMYSDAGGNVIDTAINYGGGASESDLGELLSGRRDRFVLGTKYAWTRDGTDPNAAGNHRKNLVRSLETSLRRLRTDYIDLYWVHIWDPLTPVEETVRALNDAVRSGKVLHVGFSDTPAWVVSQAATLAAQRGLEAPAAVQAPYNVVQRDIEREILPMAESHGLTVASWGPLAKGAMAGRRALETLNATERQAAETVATVAKEVGATPAQVALAWTRSRHRLIHPIVGASSSDQLRELLGGVDLVLPDEAVARLDAASDFTLGFPSSFITQAAPVYGESFSRVDPS